MSDDDDDDEGRLKSKSEERGTGEDEGAVEGTVIGVLDEIVLGGRR